MKIKFNSAKPTRTPIFQDLEFGDVFTRPGGQEVYMKVYDTGAINTIDLASGSYTHMFCESPVFPRPLATLLMEGE